MTRVFIVEDEAIIAMELADCLTQLGYHVCGRALRAREALERIPAAAPDVVVMDINLGPGMGGIEVAEQLRDRIDAPVLFLTAYSDAELADRASRTGSFAYLVKPFHPQALRANIEMALSLRAADRALRESEARFRHVVGNIREAILVDDLDGRVVYCNERFLEVFGLSAADVGALRLEDYVAPGWRALLRERHDRRLAGDDVPSEFEYEGLRRDGTRVWVSVAVALVRDRRGIVVGTQSVLRDVTERRLVTTTLDLLSTKLGRLRGGAFVGAAVREIARLLEVDAAFVCERVSGSPPRLRTVAWIVDGKAQPAVEFDVEQTPCGLTFAEGRVSLGQGVRERFGDAPLVRDSAAEAYVGVALVDSRGAPIGTLGVLSRTSLPEPHRVESVLRLLAVRTAAELEREVIEARLVDLFEQSPDGQLVVGEDGAVQLANARAHQILGYEPGDLVGRSVEEFVALPSRARHLRQRHGFGGQGAARPMGRRGQPFAALRRDGSLLPVDVSLAPLRSHGGTLVLASIRDVSARVKSEEAYRELEDRLRQSQRLEAMGSLAGGIAHDFNNILTAIRAHLEVAVDGIGPTHAVAPSLGDIGLAVDRAIDLVRQILTFSRQQAPRRAPVSLPLLVDEVTRLLRATVPRRVALSTTYAPDVPPVSADASQLHQVLVNLVTNAVHAIEGRGEVRLRVESCTVSTPGPEGAPPGRYVRLTCEDDGAGIDPGVQARIFDPFFTTRSEGRGTGLGLAVVQGIVRDHGGVISVQSAPGRGTRFDVLLPAREDRPKPLAPAIVPGARGSGRVLYLDDDPLIVSAATQLIESLGFAATGFVDASQALTALTSDPFDLVITDFHMPGRTGLEVAAEIARVRPGLPVVLVSGAGDWDEAALRAHGVVDHLDKPYGLTQLEAVLQNTLRPSGRQRTVPAESDRPDD